MATKPLKRQKHYCGAPDCKEQISGTHVLCDAHWRRLPPGMRTAITTAWNAGRNGDWTNAVMDARNWHRNHPTMSSAALAARITGDVS